MGRGGMLGAMVAAGLSAACLVDVDHVQDPRPRFDKARAEARAAQGQPGPAHEVNVLTYDPRDGELVRVSLPLWLARRIGRDGETDGGTDEWEGRLRRHVSFRDLGRAGRGILVEIEEEDGEQVLIWLR